MHGMDASKFGECYKLDQISVTWILSVLSQCVNEELTRFGSHFDMSILL